jgi:hypothetical protein
MSLELFLCVVGNQNYSQSQGTGTFLCARGLTQGSWAQSQQTGGPGPDDPFSPSPHEFGSFHLQTPPWWHKCEGQGLTQAVVRGGFPRVLSPAQNPR